MFIEIDMNLKEVVCFFFMRYLSAPLTNARSSLTSINYFYINYIILELSALVEHPGPVSSASYQCLLQSDKLMQSISRWLQGNSEES